MFLLVKDVIPIEKQFPAYPTVVDINNIREILPHRMLQSMIIFFGHFSERPILPALQMN
ncbi:hypothetical protein MKW94_013477 [Papaver nudicaule]|uniref:Uncharacterized protein n=1 Tax=Papaver nudicaule TaxID=74823 RepID=A0AA41V4K8_PAPNU|nr:hypothetical protein [Papaver nudicaule]